MSRILIIDDERAIRRSLREILEFEEFEVDEAENGKDGLEKALAKAYDIIFCDIKTFFKKNPYIFFIDSSDI